jgi:sulfide:quinone oxidoreductase
MNRRSFLKYTSISTGALVLGSGTIGYNYLHPEKIKSKAHIVIIGAGTGGLTTAAKLAQRLDGAKITIVDGNKKHQYQPGFTLIGCGVFTPDEVTRNNADYIPDNVSWIQEMVAEYNPDSNFITTVSGKKISYDFLVVAPGIQLNWTSISGLEEDMLGRNGIGSIYHSPKIAEQTWHEVQRFVKTGGVGLFTKPDGRIKCGGAPLKAIFLTESLSQDTGKRKDFDFVFLTGKHNLFSIPELNQMCIERCEEKTISRRCMHTLTAIDSDRKLAYFRTEQGRKEFSYDYIHIVPPMSAPDNVKHSPLSWKTGEHSRAGWLEVDKFTLQHRRYPNIFGVGDVVGTPHGKSGASIKKQAPAVAKNIINMLQGQDPQRLYNGYSSCMLATAMGCAALIEFDYSDKFTPTFPFLDPTNDGIIGWSIKVYAIKPMYFQMIQGRIPA